MFEVEIYQNKRITWNYILIINCEVLKFPSAPRRSNQLELFDSIRIFDQVQVDHLNSRVSNLTNLLNPSHTFISTRVDRELFTPVTPQKNSTPT